MPKLQSPITCYGMCWCIMIGSYGTSTTQHIWYIEAVKYLVVFFEMETVCTTVDNHHVTTNLISMSELKRIFIFMSS